MTDACFLLRISGVLLASQPRQEPQVLVQLLDVVSNKLNDQTPAASYISPLAVNPLLG